MQSWFIYMIGFTAQLLFSGRLIVQWITLEKQREVHVPKSFWQLSLLASLLLFIYGYLRNDFAIMLGQVITYFIYIRNLQIQHEWLKLSRWLRVFLWMFPFVTLLYYYNNNVIDLVNLFYLNSIPNWLLVLGAFSQLVFTIRFVYQWRYSENRRESHLPIGFWILSLIGAILILGYAILRKDPVLVVGHLMGSVVYIRNIFLYGSRTRIS